MIDEILNEADSKMDKSVEATREEFAAIRAGRVSPTMFNKIVVEYYGTPTPLQQLASFTSPEPRIILISPFDMGAMHNIEKAIRDSDLGVNPANDGKLRNDLTPLLKDYFEAMRNSLRDIEARNITYYDLDDKIQAFSNIGLVYARLLEAQKQTPQVEKVCEDLLLTITTKQFCTKEPGVA